jgi:uncharacterized protein YjbI with pentapeptide repeats
MKKTTKEELKIILEQHKLWLDSDGEKGKRADLSSAILTCVDLSGADLRLANLRHTNLSDADLTHANLSGADLTGANLFGADLTGSNLSRADLFFADLSSVDLFGADLTGADLTNVNLYHANLTDANLYNANLTDANLTHANLTDADLTGTYLTYVDLTDTILDEKEQCRKGIVLTEPMIGYKKARGGKIITLEMPIGSKVFSIHNKKRRTNKVKVIDMQGEAELGSIRDNSFKYHVGDEIEITDFDERYNVECSTGIHFFLTREEAEEYIY